MFRKLLLALAAVCLMTGSAVAADAFPNRPITIVVPFAAGGETDLVARMLADGMSKGTQTGRGRAEHRRRIRRRRDKRAVTGLTKPDGYTLGVTRARRWPCTLTCARFRIRWIRSTSWAVSAQGSDTSSWSQDRALFHA